MEKRDRRVEDNKVDTDSGRVAGTHVVCVSEPLLREQHPFVAP